MGLTRNQKVAPEIINKTPCERNYACLSGNAACHVEPFLDRELLLLRCLDERPCAFRKKYQGRFICSCPVNIASFSHN